MKSRAVTGLLCLAGLMAAPAWADTVQVSTATPKYPSTCTGVTAGTSGLCILVSTQPVAEGFFKVKNTRTGKSVDVYRNSFVGLPPGNYLAYNQLAVIDGYGTAFTVETGKMTTIKTGTLSLDIDQPVDLQAKNDTQGSTTTGTQCKDQALTVFNTSTHQALMPGSYVVDHGDNNEINAADCTKDETQVSLTAGQQVILKVRK